MCSDVTKGYERLSQLEHEYLNSICHEGPTAEKFNNLLREVRNIDIPHLLRLAPPNYEQTTIILECLRHLDEVYWVTPAEAEEFDNYWFELLATLLKHLDAETLSLDHIELLSGLAFWMNDNAPQGLQDDVRNQLLGKLRSPQVEQRINTALKEGSRAAKEIKETLANLVPTQNT